MLDELLAAWRETLDPAVEDAIDRVGEQIARTQPPITGRTKAAVETAWHAVAEAGDPRDLHRLLATPWPKQGPAIEARLGVLLAWPADPRIGAKVLQAVLPRYRDSRIDPLLARSPSTKLATLLAGWPEYMFPRARIAVARPRKRADPALLARVPASETRAPHDLERASFADPADLALRRVLADALQEAGDPRGEFIALQLAVADGTADRKAHARIAELLAANLDRWVQVLPNVVPASAEFERGFLVKLTSTARGNVLDASIENPAWAVVEELTLDGRAADVGALLERMPRLRLLVTRDEILAKLVHARGSFPGIAAIGTPTKWIDGLRDVFPDARVIAGQWARRYEPFADDLRAIHERSAAATLDALFHVKVALDHVGEILAQRASGPAETRFSVTMMDEPGWLVSVARDAPRAALAFNGGTPTSRDQIETLLVDLAEAGIRDIHVFDEPRVRAAVEYTLRNRKKRLVGCTIAFDGAPIDPSAPITSR